MFFVIFFILFFFPSVLPHAMFTHECILIRACRELLAKTTLIPGEYLHSVFELQFEHRRVIIDDLGILYGIIFSFFL